MCDCNECDAIRSEYGSIAEYHDMIQGDWDMIAERSLTQVR
jgi:hypothetical protein